MVTKRPPGSLGPLVSIRQPSFVKVIYSVLQTASGLCILYRGIQTVSTCTIGTTWLPLQRCLVAIYASSAVRSGRAVLQLFALTTPWPSVVQGVLQNLTSTVGSAASSVSSSAKNAVNRLTGDGNNGGLGPMTGSPVCSNSLDSLVCLPSSV